MVIDNTYDKVRWFARCGDRYVKAYLGHIDVDRLATDKDYGLKLLLFGWAFERSGAPRAYRIAAVKAVSSIARSHQELGKVFGEFCQSKIWKKGNIPVVDQRIDHLDVREIIQQVKEGALSDAFRKLELKGMGHKLKSFFLRDLVTLFHAEPKLANNRNAYLWCQPIDVWVRLAAQALESDEPDLVRGDRKKYQLNGDDLKTARKIVDLSIHAGVSPLKVNQGIWYFSANAVADEKRLQKLIGERGCDELDDELALMDGFLPTQPMWGETHRYV